MSRERNRSWTRRRLLAAGGAAATVGVAGCTGGVESDAANRETAADRGTTTDEPLGGHPAAVGVGDQPRLGPPPTDAEGVVVAFEDPSCPRCAAFETETVPKIREELGDRVSFVFRGYPVVYPWGEPAAQAIEAAFAREMESMGMEGGTEDGTNEETETDGESGTNEETEMDDETMMEDAPYGSAQGTTETWALIRHYFENQSDFDEGSVFDRTREFLAAETDLDAEAVVADAEEQVHDDAVQADLDAGEAADVGNTTPTVFLFRDGEFRTSANGSVSFEVVRSALGL